MTEKEVSELTDENYKTILNSMGDPVFVKDFQSKLVLVNDAFCKVFGRSRTEIIGKTLAEDVSPEERDGFLKVDRQVISTGIESVVEESLTIRGGKTRTISTRKTRFIDKMGGKFLVGIIRDITDYKEAEELSRRNEYNELLLNAARILSNPESNYKLGLQALAKEVSVHLNVVCDISILERETDIIRPEALYHPDAEIRKLITNLFSSMTIKKGQGMVGSVIETGKEIIIIDAPETIRQGPMNVDPRIVPQSLMYVPLMGSSSVLGSLNLTRLQGQPKLNEIQVEQIRRLGEYVSLFVENSLLKEQQALDSALRKQAEQKLERDKSWSEFKLELSTLLADVDVDLTSLLQLFAKKVAIKFNAVCAIQLVHQEKKDEISIVALYHSKKKIREAIENALQRTTMKVGEGLVGKVVETGEEYVSYSLPKSLEKVAGSKTIPNEIMPSSIVYLPLKGHHGILGTLDVTTLASDKPISAHDVEQLRDLADHAGRFVENRVLQIKQKRELQLRRKAEQKLERAGKILEGMEAETRAILNTIPINIARVSKDFRYKFLNDTFRKVGMDPRKMEGRCVKETIGEEGFKKLQPFFNRVLAGETLSFDYDGLMPDGQHYYFNVAMAPDFSESGEIIGFYTCGSDVTSKVLAEKEAKLTQDRLDTLSLNSGDAFFFHDLNQTILDVNQVAVDMLGYSRDEFLSMKASQLDHRWSGKYYQKFLEDLDVNIPQTFDTQVYHKDGREIPVEVRFVKRQEADNIYIQSLIRDRTEKREQELKLQKSEERLRLLFENVEDHIAIVDEKGTIETINKTSQDVDPEDVIGSTIYNFYSNQNTIKVVEEKFKKLVDEGENFLIEDPFTGPDGTTMVYSIKYIGIFLGDKFFKAIVIIRDITADKHREYSIMNAALKGQEQERKRLGAELHDGIGQIMSAIALQVSQISEEVSDKNIEHTRKDLSQLTDKLHEAIRELRNISHDLMPEVLESFGLKEAINQTCNNLKGRSGIRVAFDHVDVEARYDQFIEVNLYRIAQELLTNVQKHANCSNVFISLMDHGTSISLTVEDDGVGFKTQHDKEFKGIGLSNVYSRVNMMNGQIDVESNENSGTLVNIEVPKKVE